MRAVIYNDRRGGYIDNVPSTFTRKDTDLGIYYATTIRGLAERLFRHALRAGHVATTTPSPAERLQPGRPIPGTRASALFQINDDWNVLVTQSYQNMDAEGVFYQMPQSSDGAPLQPLQVTLFNNSYDKDRFENTAWTVNGKLGRLEGGLYRRLPGAPRRPSRSTTPTMRAACMPTTTSATAQERAMHPGGTAIPRLTSHLLFAEFDAGAKPSATQHLSNEFRVSTPDDWRIRGIVGVFYEQNKLFDQTDWSYKTIPACTSNTAPGTPGQFRLLSNIGTAPGATTENPGVQNDNVAFFEDTQREYKQTAFFGSVDFDIIPEGTHGHRRALGTKVRELLHRQRDAAVSSVLRGRCAGRRVHRAARLIINAKNLRLHGIRHQEPRQYHLARHAGHDGVRHIVAGLSARRLQPSGRPGRLDPRPRRQAASSPYRTTITPDDLTNNEIGWKTEFFDHRFQWNGAVYQENWDNVQIGFFDPGETSNLAFGTNGQNFRIRGVETSIVARVTQGLTLQGAASWNSSTADEFTVSDRYEPGQRRISASAITEHCIRKAGAMQAINNLFGPLGSPSANSPPIQFNLRARYDWAINSYNAFVQVGGQHTDHSYTQSGNDPSHLGSAAPSTRPCCASRIRRTRHTTPRSAWPRMPGARICSRRT